MMAVRSPQDIIAKNLSSLRGYPLWTPEQSIEFLANRPEGLRIGDVGVVLPDHGGFDCFFNLCVPRDHAFHASRGVPEGFSHIELSDEDITTIRDAEPPGGVIKSSSVKSVRIREQPATSSDGSSRYAPLSLKHEYVGVAPNDANQMLVRVVPATTDYEFNVSSKEGAILILPDGAERQQVKDARPFFEQAAKHAAAWYRFGEQNLGRLISHQSMYVITGFTAARTWSIAGFEEGQGDSTGCFRFSPQNRGGYGSTFNWNSSGPRSFDWRLGDRSETANQTVLIHGFKIALRSVVRGVPQRWSRFEPAARSHVEGGSWLSNAMRGLSRTIGLSGEDRYEHMGGVQIEVSCIPEILPVFHPGEAINDYLLYKVPSAKVAITHDSDWGALLEEELIQPEHLANDELLEAAISEHYTILSQDGVAYLQRKTQRNSKRSPTLSQPSIGESHNTKPNGSQSLNVVSSSNYRCTDDRPTTSSEIPPEDLLSLSSSFVDTASVASEHLASPELRVIKIMIISDYLCSFCYLMDKVVHEAIEACHNLPVRFDVEFRPFTLLSASAADSNKGMSRNAYIIKKFGKEQAEVKLKAVSEMSEKAGLKLSEHAIICRTIQAQRLSMKAYQVGGQVMQRKFNAIIFNASLAEGKDVSDDDILADAAAAAGLMLKEEAIKYLRSDEDLDRVEKMIEAAKAQGVNGVPFVIIDGKWAVNGVQPADCFIQIFRKLAHSPVSSTLSGKSKE